MSERIDEARLHVFGDVDMQTVADTLDGVVEGDEIVFDGFLPHEGEVIRAVGDNVSWAMVAAPLDRFAAPFAVLRDAEAERTGYFACQLFMGRVELLVLAGVTGDVFAAARRWQAWIDRMEGEDK